MPRDPLLPDSTAPIRLHSSDDEKGSERKRRRKVLSCYDCRRRKLQCDRAMPACSRCTKAGQAANCLYLDDATDTPTRNPEVFAESSRAGIEAPSSHPIQPSGELLTRLEYQDRRIRELESALTQSSHTQFQQSRGQKLPLTPESMNAVDIVGSAVNATDCETMLLRGKSFKTQFHGISYPGSLIAYIPELAMFTKETVETFPGLARMRNDLHVLEDRPEYAGSKSHWTSDDELKALLPSRLEVDEFVQLYLDNYDSIYHIIHLPSFHQEYTQMWSDLSNTRAHFVAIVLLMMAVAQCSKTREPWLYTGNSSTARENALRVIQPVEDWLRTQSQKHVTVIDFQIRFLLNVARMVNASKFKRTWTDAGTLLRFHMAAGLHRNPELLRKPTSAMDKEMRRRLWSAAAEFELQAAFNRGMLSMPWPQQSDYVPPTNISDDEFDQDTQHLPSSKPLSEFTSTSYLALADQTFMLRYTLNSLLNNVRQTLNFEEVKRYTEEIEQHLRRAPQWIDSTSETPLILWSLTLRQYLLVLHDRQIRQDGDRSERTFSKMIIIDTAKKITSDHRLLLDRGIRTLQFLCHDQLRAALSVCHAFATPEPQADSALNQIIEQTATEVIKDANELITDKITRLGCEQRQLWIVLAAKAFMKTRKDPDQKLVYMQAAVDVITKPFYKILACQEDAPSAMTGAPPAGRADLPDGMIEYLPATTGQQLKEGNLATAAATDPVLLDFDSIAAWTFDDWSFNPADFPGFGVAYPAVEG